MYIPNDGLWKYVLATGLNTDLPLDKTHVSVN